MNELENKEKLMTTKELAETLNISVDSVQNSVKKLAENNRRVFSDIKRNKQGGYLFNEEQVTAIKLELQNHSKINATSPKTLLEKQLIIQQAIQIQNELISELQKENELQKQQIQNQEKQLIEQKPKIEALNRLSNGKGCFSMNQTAKALKLPYGNITLYKQLREMQILNSDNTPKQEQINNGNFKVVIKFVNPQIGDKYVTLTTAKGLVYLARKFNTEIDETIKADYTNDGNINE